jgi:RNA polymerase sigma-70 factor (TIGR02957 family)
VAEPVAGPDPFVDLRGLLVAIAYEVTGSVADAEDVVQEAWLRWREVDAGTVRDPRAYLARTVSRLALNRLRTVARRREEYVGPWLPEPLVDRDEVVAAVETADDVSTALLVVLESLGPVERVVFVMREVFGFAYDEIAAAVDKQPAAVRQIAARSRAHVQARRPRHVFVPEDHRRAVERFHAAATRGDVMGLLDVLAPDVELVTDGGGVVQAALRPIRGVDKVLRFLAGVQPPEGTMRTETVEVNGRTGLLLVIEGRVDAVVSLELIDGLVSRVFLVRNPVKVAAALGGP